MLEYASVEGFQDISKTEKIQPPTESDKTQPPTEPDKTQPSTEEKPTKTENTQPPAKSEDPSKPKKTSKNDPVVKKEVANTNRTWAIVVGTILTLLAANITLNSFQQGQAHWAIISFISILNIALSGILLDDKCNKTDAKYFGWFNIVICSIFLIYGAFMIKKQ